MCQIKIYNFLRELRSLGDNNYYLASEIYNKMKDSNIYITDRRFSYKCTMLLNFGFIEKAPTLRYGKGNFYNRVQYRAKV